MEAEAKLWTFYLLIIFSQILLQFILKSVTIRLKKMSFIIAEVKSRTPTHLLTPMSYDSTINPPFCHYSSDYSYFQKVIITKPGQKLRMKFYWAISIMAIYIIVIRKKNTRLCLVPHICVEENISHFPSDAHMRDKHYQYFSYLLLHPICNQDASLATYMMGGGWI